MGELCARFEVKQPDAPEGRGVIFVKSRWFATKFSMWVTDGLDAWVGEVSEEEVSRKAFSWDCTVAEYLEAAEKYLGVQDSTSVYSFISQGNGARKLSWTLVRDGVELIANWRMEKSLNPKEITCDILDFLMTGSSRLSEELQRKRRSLEQQKAEADRSLAQSVKFRDERLQFEEEIYKKFVAVLNSKKNKLRDVKEQALRLSASEAKNAEEGNAESQDEFDEETDREDEDEDASKDDSKAMETTRKDDDQDSGATEILPADSPTPDISSMEPGPSSHSPTHDFDQSEGNSNAHVAPTSSLHPPTEGVTDPATFLSGSTYTSAPRKRRKQ
ncbi:unnamed protein product [Calypogeia fissa]